MVKKEKKHKKNPHLNDAIILLQASALRRRGVVHNADVVSRLVLFRVEVEPIAVQVAPLTEVAEARGELCRAALVGRGGTGVGNSAVGADSLGLGWKLEKHL